jgi:hypothetical protein
VLQRPAAAQDLHDPAADRREPARACARHGRGV